MALQDIVVKPVEHTAKGIAKGAEVGVKTGLLGGAGLGVLTMWAIGLANPVTALVAGAAVAVAASVALVGFVTGPAGTGVGGAIGAVKGAAKGVAGLFSGKSRVAPGEAPTKEDVDVLRLEDARIRAETARMQLQRQQERAAALGENPDARSGFAAKVTQQQQTQENLASAATR